MNILTTNSLPQNWKTRFFALWFGQSSSLFGSAITQFILIWWITTTTKSVLALTLASFFGLLPQAILDQWGEFLQTDMIEKK